MNVSDLPEFEQTKFLGSDEHTAAYLTAIVKEDDAGLRAGRRRPSRGKIGVAGHSGVAREALHKAFALSSNRCCDAVSCVCAAIGVRFFGSTGGHDLVR